MFLTFIASLVITTAVIVSFQMQLKHFNLNWSKKWIEVDSGDMEVYWAQSGLAEMTRKPYCESIYPSLFILALTLSKCNPSWSNLVGIYLKEPLNIQGYRLLTTYFICNICTQRNRTHRNYSFRCHTFGRGDHSERVAASISCTSTSGEILTLLSVTILKSTSADEKLRKICFDRSQLVLLQTLQKQVTVNNATNEILHSRTTS